MTAAPRDRPHVPASKNPDDQSKRSPHTDANAGAPIAAAISIQCISRPPSNAPSGFVSFGNTISFISDCESRTGRGRNESCFSVIFMVISFAMWLFSVLLRVVCSEALRPSAPPLQMLLHKTVRQFLSPDLGMRRNPVLQNHVILEHSMPGRPVLRLIHKLQRNSLPRVVRDHKAHRIAVALLRQPGTQFLITQIAAFKFLMIDPRVLV